MAVYSLDNINNEYISFEEAVISLLESYDLTLEEAVFIVEDYIEEASKKDMEKAADIGEGIHSRKVGNNASQKKINDPGQTLYTALYDPSKMESEWNKDRRKYMDTHRIDTSKLETIKPKTQKDYARDSAKSLIGTVPKHGANPEYSRDADKKAVAAYKKSTTKNQWKNYDIDKSIKGMDATKARIVKDRMERGEDLPKSIKKRLAKKGDTNPNKPYIDDITFKGDNIYTRKIEDPEERKKAYEAIKMMYQQSDPGKIRMGRENFLKIMGLPKYDKDILWPRVNEPTKTVTFKADKKPKIKSNIKKLDHVSGEKNIQNLFPSDVGTEGITFSGPKVFGSEYPTNKNGMPISKDSIKAGVNNVYEINSKGRKVFKDNTTKGKDSYYIETDRKIPVKKPLEDEVESKVENAGKEIKNKAGKFIDKATEKLTKDKK